MSGFSDLTWQWSEPSDLEFSFTERWSGSRCSLYLDAFSRLSDSECVKCLLEQVETKVIEAGGLDGDHFSELIEASKELGAFVRNVLYSFRSGPRWELRRSDFKRMPLRDVLKLGRDNVAFYFALDRDRYRSLHLSLRAHTRRGVDTPLLWFEKVLPADVSCERGLVAAAGILKSMTSLNDGERHRWLDELSKLSAWVVDATMPTDPTLGWTRQKKISFVVGSANCLSASVFKRSEIRKIVVNCDWIIVTVEREPRICSGSYYSSLMHDSRRGQIYLKCAAGRAFEIEETLLNGSRLAFYEGVDIVGLAEFEADTRDNVWQNRCGKLVLWRLALRDLRGFFPWPEIEVTPGAIEFSGRLFYKVFLTGKVEAELVNVRKDSLDFVWLDGDHVTIYPWVPARRSGRSERVDVLVRPDPFAENTVTVNRRIAQLGTKRRAGATVVQRVAVNRASEYVDVFITTAEFGGSATKRYCAENLTRLFGADWRNLDAPHFHLLASHALKNAVLR